jgi:hypothetical protein
MRQKPKCISLQAVCKQLRGLGRLRRKSNSMHRVGIRAGYNKYSQPRELFRRVTGIPCGIKSKLQRHQTVTEPPFG